MKQLLQQTQPVPDESELSKKKPAEQEEWPEDDVAEKYIKQGGKVETPSEEDDEEVNRKLKESKQPKK